MRKKYKASLIIIVILILLVSLIGISSIFFNNNSDSSEPKNTTSIISNITDYGYTLDDRDTKYMKECFEELKNTLNSESINYEEYAKDIAKIFITDFFTLNNKINKYDVGGLEYILNSKVDMFKNKAMDTIYNGLIDNTYKDRIQELPEITNVEVLSLKETTEKIASEEYSGYELTLESTYLKDLGYPTKCTLKLIKNNNKLEIINYNPTI